MLKKLHDGNSKSTEPEIPYFLQKDGSKDQESSKIFQNGTKNDSNHLNQAVDIDKKKELKEDSSEAVRDSVNSSNKSTNSINNDKLTSPKPSENISSNTSNDKATEKLNNNTTTTSTSMTTTSTMTAMPTNTSTATAPTSTSTATALTSTSTTTGGLDDGTKRLKAGVGQAKVTSLKTNTDIYKCTINACKLSFTNTNDFQAHISLHHPNLTTIPCCFCFNSPPSIEYFPHLTSHIKNVMKCLYCQVSHDTREELLKHLTETHPNQPKKINVCIRILNNLRGKKSLDKGNKANQVNKNISSRGKLVLSNSGKVDNNVGKGNDNTSSKSKVNENTTNKVDVNNNEEERLKNRNETKLSDNKTSLNTNSTIDIKPTVTQNNSDKKPPTTPNNNDTKHPTTPNNNNDTKHLITSNNNNDPKNTKNDQSTKSRSRKSLKPVKSLVQSVVEDEVEIRVVSGDLAVVCKQCSFTCGTESSLKQHCLDVHIGKVGTVGEDGEGGLGLFCCKLCSMKTDNKDEFFNHLAHHKLNSQVPHNSHIFYLLYLKSLQKSVNKKIILYHFIIQFKFCF